MTDFESEVRTMLEDAAADTPPLPPLSRRTKRRLFFARSATALGTAAVIVGLVVGGIFGATALWDDDETDPAGDRRLDTQRPVLASGVADGFRWELSVYRDNGLLCKGFSVSRVEDSVRLGQEECPLRLKEDTTLQMGAGHVLPEGPRSLVYADGAVTNEASRVVLVLEDGSRQPLILHDPPQEVGTPVLFFVVAPLPDTADNLIAFDEEGKKLGCWEIIGPFFGPTTGRNMVSVQTAVIEGCR